MQKERIEKVNKKKLSAWIQYGIIAAATISLGVAGGIIIKRRYGGEEITYSGFDPESFKADSKELLKEYEKNPKKRFTPAEKVCIGMEKYKNAENSYNVSIGLADTIVKQTIRNAQIKQGNTYFEEQISRSSMVSMANRSTQKGEEIKFYKGKATSDEKGNYPSEYTTFKADEYKSLYGKRLDEMFIYIISNKTVHLDKCKSSEKNGQIKIFLDLDPDIATYYYKIQMKGMSNLSGLPVFEYVKLTYTFDLNMTLLHMKVDEKYKASMAGVTATIVNNIDNYYFAGKKIKIPALNESLNYSKLKGETNYE